MHGPDLCTESLFALCQLEYFIPTGHPLWALADGENPVHPLFFRWFVGLSMGDAIVELFNPIVEQAD